MKINVVLITLAVFAASTVVADPYPFGRIFTTSEERKILDHWRRTGNMPQNEEISAAVPKTQQESALKKIELSGFILREDGSSVVWVNGKSVLSPSKDAVKTSSPRSSGGSISVYHDGKRARLKPGQAWMVEDNTVKEVYEVTPAAQSSPIQLEEKVVEQEKNVKDSDEGE